MSLLTLFGILQIQYHHSLFCMESRQPVLNYLDSQSTQNFFSITFDWQLCTFICAQGFPGMPGWGYENFFMLNSAKHEIFPAHEY